MVDASWVESEVLKAVPNAVVEVIDLHGSGDHFHVRVISEEFEGVRPLQRQKRVLAVMKQHIPHPVHALDLKCMTPNKLKLQAILHLTLTVADKASTSKES